MQEVLEQIVDYLKGIWLKRRFIIITSWLLCPIGWFFVASLDDVYESEARVYADTQSILRPLLKGITVENNPDVQIQLMVRTLLSRPNIERISRMTDLDVLASNAAEYEQTLENLKENIIIRKTGGRKENIFNISFEAKDPELAKNVVQSALTVFIENTLGENRSDSDAAQKFLETQIKEYENRLLASEARLTDFKQKYSNVLPNQYGGYYDKLNIAKEQLKAIELSLLEYETQLAAAKEQLKSNLATDKSVSSDKIVGSTVKTTYDDRIAELEANLDGLLLRYTENHPDVKEVKRRLAHLENQRSEEIKSYIATQGEASNLSNLSDNPVIQGIQIQVNSLETQVASLTVRANDQRSVVQDLENKIHTLPEIEAELTALNRGYEITKDKYEELLSRKETAQLAKQADETTNKIQFRVIDPPRVPLEPSGPKRILLATAVTIVGFGAGIGLSLLFSQITPVVTSASQVTRETGIPVFGAVSATENLGLQNWHKKKTWIFILSNSVLLMIFLAFLAIFMFPEKLQAPLSRIF